MKTITINLENWERLNLLKLKWKKKSLDEVVSELIVQAGDKLWQ